MRSVNKKITYSQIIFFTFAVYIIIFSISTPAEGHNSAINFRNEMRKFVVEISSIGKKKIPGFLVIPQNALELLTINGRHNDPPAEDYLSSIDGIGLEEFLFGLPRDGAKTSKRRRAWLLPFIKLVKKRGKQVLVTDYIKGNTQARRSYRYSRKFGILSFQAERSLSKIPDIGFDFHKGNVDNINSALNFLYLINFTGYRNPEHFIFKVNKNSWDLLIIDPFFWGKVLTWDQVRALKRKPGGKRRMVIAYMSIGEAESYRYYWKRDWKRNPPAFMYRENPEWKENYKVRYWMAEWKKIIIGAPDGRGFKSSYLKKIIDAGFDGVYLDILDAAFYFEKRVK